MNKPLNKPMNKTLVIPVWNDESTLPALLKALKASLKKDPMELLFVDAASRDGSLALLKEFAAGYGHARILREEKPGYANALNTGLAQAKGEFLYFLFGESLPQAGWSTAFTEALGDFDLAVGQTESALPKKPGPFTRVAAALFKGRSARSASAQGFALPWGAMNNFAARREWFQRLGGFSAEAGSAYDMDWCWRAVLAGATIGYAPKAEVLVPRPADRESALHHFESYGQGEAWMHQTYAFLLGEDASPDAVLAASEAFLRLRRYSPAAKVKALQEPLEEVAAAFAGGVRLGYGLGAKPCGLRREAPKRAIGWDSGKKEMTVLVPGKGITTLPAQPAQLFRAWRKGAGIEELETLFRKVFKASTAEAQHGVEDLLEALSPAEGPGTWVPVSE